MIKLTKTHTIIFSIVLMLVFSSCALMQSELDESKKFAEMDYSQLIYGADEIADIYLEQYVNDVKFTPEEQAAIDAYKNKTVKVAISTDSVFLTSIEGNYVGSTYYAALQLEKDLGLDFEIVLADSVSIYENAAEYDIVSSYSTSVIKSFFNESGESNLPLIKSDAFYTTQYGIYVRNSLEEELSLSGILEKNTGVYCTYYEEGIIDNGNVSMNYFPGLVYSYRMKDLIDNKELDYFILPVNSIAEQNGLNRVNIDSGTYTISRNYFLNSSLNENFISAINKTINENKEKNIMAYAESSELLKCSQGYFFTEEEKEFIQNNPVIRTGFYTNFYPYVYYDEEDGTYYGKLVEILNRISDVIGLQFKNVNIENNSTVSSMLAGLKDSSVDLTVGLGITLERMGYVYYSNLYMNETSVLIGYSNNVASNDIYECEIGVIENSFMNNYISEMYPTKVLKKYRSSDEAYNALKNGEIDLFASNQSVYYFLVNDNYDYKLKIAKTLDVNPNPRYLTPRTEEGLLCLSIIDKVSSRISTQEILNAHYPLADVDTLSVYKSKLLYLSIVCTLLALIALIVYFGIQVLKTKKHNNYIQNLNNNMNNAIKIAKFAIMQYDFTTNSIILNETVVDLLGICKEDIVIRNNQECIDNDLFTREYQIVHGSNAVAQTENIRDFANGNVEEFTTKIEVKRCKKNDDIVYCDLLGKRNVVNKNRVDIIVKDITTEILQLKYHELTQGRDELTRALNRKSAFEIDLKKCEGKILAYVDFDNFAQINNTFSNTIGDNILIEFTRVTDAREYVDEIYRVAGTEFLLVLNRFSEEIAREILGSIQKTVCIDSLEVELDGSMGVLILVDYCAFNMDDVINITNYAMEQAKSNIGIKYCIVDNEIVNEYNTTNSLDGLVRNAIKNGEIIPYFQPYVDVFTGEIVGYETLMRWISDEKIISPNMFLPIAFKNGMIYDVDILMFKKSVQFLKQLQDAGLVCDNFSASSNFTPITLLSIEPQELLDYVTEVGVNPRNVTVEITEQLFANDDALRNLGKLKNMGFKIAIDDFSVGHSSIAYLKRLRADVIKLDKSLLEDTQDKTNLSIYKTVVDLGLSFDAKIISEGVESEEDVEILKKSKVRIAQGFFFAKPEKSELIYKFIEERKKSLEKTVL